MTGRPHPAPPAPPDRARAKLASPEPAPLVTFHRLVPEARLPTRADRAAGGSLPTRAFRYCEAIVSASAFGYYLFSPITFSVVWDGTGMRWTWNGAGAGGGTGPGGADWQPLESAQFPHFSGRFDRVAPPDLRGFAPPFVSALQEPGLLQVWSGYIARTRPDWSLLLRPPANLPRKPGYEVFEGIVESDRWFGPLFGAVRITRTDAPVTFSADYPLFQVQPLPRSVYAAGTLDDFTILPELTQLTPQDWGDYRETVKRPNVQVQRPRGQYAAGVRRRRSGERE